MHFYDSLPQGDQEQTGNTHAGRKVIYNSKLNSYTEDKKKKVQIKK